MAPVDLRPPVDMRPVHDAIQTYVRSELTRHTSREALLALASIEAVLIEVSRAIHDGCQDTGITARIEQGINDAATIADVGLAIRQHRQHQK